jgi:superfamily II DNA or RNA helicase
MLRDYQLDIVERVKQSFASGHVAPLVVIPTGGGKTITAMEIVRRVKKTSRVVWLVHREELALQAMRAASKMGITVGGVGATLPEGDVNGKLLVCMVQTLMSRGAPPAALAVTDEAHNFIAKEFNKVALSYPKRLGLTATPCRGDDAGLGNAFDDLIVGPDIGELIANGFLVRCDVLHPSRTLKAGEIAQDPVDAYKQHAGGRKTIVFCSNLNACRQSLADFKQAGIKAGFVYGDMDPDDRRAEIDAFSRGQIQVLLNVGILHEGFDVPDTECAIIARPIGTQGLWLQIIGRILRAAAGKKTALLIDLWGSIHLHGPPEAKREYRLHGLGIQQVDGQARLCAVCGTPLGSARVCLACGFSPDDPVAPKVVRTSLVKYAAKRRESNEDRAATLRRWLQEAKALKQKPGRAFFKYKAVYGEPPSPEVMFHLRSPK